MYCSSCGAQHPEGSAYCPTCGNPLGGEGVDIPEPIPPGANAGHPEESRGTVPQPPAPSPRSDPPTDLGSVAPVPAQRTPGVLQYFVMLAIGFIPIVNIVVFSLWAFRRGTPRARMNFARAYLALFSLAVLVSTFLVIGFGDAVATPEVEDSDTVISLDAEDIPSEWAVPEIVAAMDSGIVSLDELTRFRDPITREEICRLLVHFYEVRTGAPAPAPAANPYTDTTSLSAQKATELGIVSIAPGQSTFRPRSRVTRAELALMLLRSARLLAADTAFDTAPRSDYADAGDLPAWSEEGMYFALNHEIFGVHAGNMAPGLEVTREQGLVCLSRLDALLGDLR